MQLHMSGMKTLYQSVSVLGIPEMIWKFWGYGGY